MENKPEYNLPLFTALYQFVSADVIYSLFLKAVFSKWPPAISHFSSTDVHQIVYIFWIMELIKEIHKIPFVETWI